MALAEYFSKNLLALSQVLNKGNSTQFQTILNTTIIGIAFNGDVKKHEGEAALDLTVRLIARLYPKINFIDLDGYDSALISKLTKLALSINSKIEIVKGEPTLLIVIGSKEAERKITQGPIYYIGSDNWLAKFSIENPVQIGDSKNPLGAGIAACIGVANIFRFIFSDFLNSPEHDEDVCLSLVSLDIDNTNPDPKTKSLDLGDIQLAGFGAIGNGFVWALSKSPWLKGILTIVEPQTLELSNLQRYVLAEERHVNKSKLNIAEEALKGSKIKLVQKQMNWAQYLNQDNSWDNGTVIVAIDNAEDRIGIQASLPQEIINAYTENNVIGISRHPDFVSKPCLVCLYMPSGKRKSYSQEVSDNLNLPQLERQIRDYIFYNKVADDQLLGWVSEANKIDFSELVKFKGIPVQEFYSRVVCGGTLMQLRNEEGLVEHIEAPLAFQSAMAGILQLAELVIQKAGFRKKQLDNISQFYPLSPVKSGSNPYNHSFPKDNSGRCICGDKDFINEYQNKWSNS